MTTLPYPSDFARSANAVTAHKWRDAPAAEPGRHAPAVQEMRVALRSRQNARCLAVRLAQRTIGRAQSGHLHLRCPAFFLVSGKTFWCQGQVLAKSDKVPTARRFCNHDVEDQSGNQRLGFLIPVHITGRSGFIKDQSVGERTRIVGKIGPCGVEHVERIESRRRFACHGKGIEHMHRAKTLTRAHGDLCILAFWIDSDEGASSSDVMVRHNEAALLFAGRVQSADHGGLLPSAQ